ncbi:NIPSNAP family protein [Pseudoduganella lutea]|uniref:NIPSNAP family protein n=1 Tax=Pseudoduganella lutea TaxID=321985 RepID=A0A4P6KRK9_9BURK|nr:NIPSNAP family protein [Pseudoduganella lutea]QBE61699.1 NIPSNAP family protein [Pseudoduganella lutea]
MRLIEIRSYKLKPGTTRVFHQLFSKKAVPMLTDWGTEVVAFGPSLHQEDGYFLIRSYQDLADLKNRQDHFYGSQEWRNGPREEIVNKIENSLDTLVWLSETGVNDLRRSNQYMDENAGSVSKPVTGTS